MLFFSPPSITFPTKHSLVPNDLIKLQHIVLFKSSHLLHGAGMQHRGAAQAGAHIQLTACFQASSLTQHVILQLTSCIIFPGEQAELFEILRRWRAPPISAPFPPACLHFCCVRAHPPCWLLPEQPFKAFSLSTSPSPCNSLLWPWPPAPQPPFPAAPPQELVHSLSSSSERQRLQG